jgi:hypothetical protein
MVRAAWRVSEFREPGPERTARLRPGRWGWDGIGAAKIPLEIVEPENQKPAVAGKTVFWHAGGG